MLQFKLKSSRSRGRRFEMRGKQNFSDYISAVHVSSSPH